MEGLKEGMIRKSALGSEQSFRGRSLPEADAVKLKSKEQEEPNRQRKDLQADVNDGNMENVLLS